MGLVRSLKALLPWSVEAQTRDLAAAAPDVIAVLEAQDDAARPLREGRAGTATITRVSGTKIFLGEEDEVLEFELQVTVEGGTPYVVVHRQPVSPQKASEYHPDATVTVKVDQTDPHRLTIVE